jgi:hypothetical protein
MTTYGMAPASPTPTGSALVERRIRVWWDGNADWFDADIIAYDEVKKLHLLQYVFITKIHNNVMHSYKNKALILF